MVKLFLISTLLLVSINVQAQQLDDILDSLDFHIKKREVYSNNKTKKIKDLLSWNGSLPYFIFTGFILIIVLVTRQFVPETKGKSLEELENIW